MRPRLSCFRATRPPGCSMGSIPSEPARSAAGLKEAARGDQQAPDQLDDPPVPHTALGRSWSIPDLGADAALAKLDRAAHTSAGSTSKTPSPRGASGTSRCRRAKRLTERKFDAIRCEGPGTDLTVGLLPTSIWQGGDASIPSTGSSTCPTCRRRRSSRRPTRARADGVVPRPSRSTSAARSSAG